MTRGQTRVRRWALVLLAATCLGSVAGGPPAPTALAASRTMTAAGAAGAARATGAVAAVGAAAPAVARASAPLPGTAWTAPLAAALQVERPFDRDLGRYSAGHRGVDLGGTGGQSVLAAGAGVVAYAGPLAGRGVVSIDHGGLRTTYEPVTASVVRGQSVRRGQVIGHLQLGHAGCDPACLHWGLRRGAEYLDPLRLLTRVPVRLLPVLGVPQP